MLPRRHTILAREFRVSHCAPGCRRRQRVTACTRPRGALGFSLARARTSTVNDRAPQLLGDIRLARLPHHAPANHLGQEQRATAQLLLGRRAGSRDVLVLSRSPGRSHLRPLPMRDRRGLRERRLSAGLRGRVLSRSSPGRSHLRPLLPCISWRRDRMPLAGAGGYHGRIP